MKQVGTNNTIKIILGIIVLLLWLLLMVFLLYRISNIRASSNSTMNQILNSGFVKMMNKIPLTIHILLLLFMGAFLVLLSTKLSMFCTGLLGVLLVYHSIIQRNECKQWLLLGAGIILILYPLQQGDYLSGMGLKLNENKAVSALFAYSTVVATILILVNQFIYIPKCKPANSSIRGSGTLEGMFEKDE